MKTLVLAFVALLLGVIASACASAGDGPKTPATSRTTETPEQAYWSGVLGQLRIESSVFALQALQAWARMENTKAQWNPLATTLKKPGSSEFNSSGVKNYPDQTTGIQATADTLLYSPSGSGSYYRAIREMLSRESFNRQELQVALIKWSGNGPYVPGLLDQWAALWSDKVAKQSTEAAAPVASAKPVAPVTAEQKPAASVAQPSTGKGFASGKYELSQIETSSSNVVVALFAAAINREKLPRALYVDEYLPETRSLTPFENLQIDLRGAAKSFLVIGNLRNPANGKFLDPKDATPGVGYLVSALFADYGGTVAYSFSTYRVRMIDFQLYKTSSAGWKIGNFVDSSSSANIMEGEMLREELKRTGNEPFKFLR